jgi:hypothetical protein
MIKLLSICFKFAFKFKFRRYAEKSDLRRARSGLCNLAPTSTGSATVGAYTRPLFSST